jgi:hypothetical protein
MIRAIAQSASWCTPTFSTLAREGGSPAAMLEHNSNDWGGRRPRRERYGTQAHEMEAAQLTEHDATARSTKLTVGRKSTAGSISDDVSRGQEWFSAPASRARQRIRGRGWRTSSGEEVKAQDLERDPRASPQRVQSRRRGNWGGGG